MKIADVSWGWTPIPEQLPEGDSLLEITKQIRKIGFEEIDYLATDEGLESWFTPENCRRLGDYARSIGIVPNVKAQVLIRRQQGQGLIMHIGGHAPLCHFLDDLVALGQGLAGEPRQVQMATGDRKSVV